MISKTKYAPIVVFAYKRTDLLKQLLMDLEKNDNLPEMDIFFFVDVPIEGDKNGLMASERVIGYIKEYKKYSPYRNTIVEVATVHRGLAENVISGVTKVINEFGRAIVFEDDLRVSSDILSYFNRALDYYEHENNIFSVTGLGPYFGKIHTANDVFFLERPSSWSWATWKDRWDTVDWSVSTYEQFKNNKKEQRAFSQCGYDLPELLDLQMTTDGFDSWAVRWAYQSFLNSQYTVYSSEFRCINVGKDEHSTHGGYYMSISISEDLPECRFLPYYFDKRIERIHQNSTKPSGTYKLKKVIKKILPNDFIIVLKSLRDDKK